MNTIFRGSTLLATLFVALMIQACAPSGQATPLPPPTILSATATRTPLAVTPDPEAQLEWLQKEPCRAPCWEGITPGVTSADQAVKLLESNPLVDNVRTAPGLISPDEAYILWRWKSGEGKSEAWFDASSLEHSVYGVRPFFAVPFTFQQVIGTYGSPSHIMATARNNPDIGSGVSYGVWILYLPQGFALVNGGLELDPKMSFSNVLFFVPTTEGFVRAGVRDPRVLERTLVPWQGFREFGFYCREYYEGANACKVP